MTDPHSLPVGDAEALVPPVDYAGHYFTSARIQELRDQRNELLSALDRMVALFTDDGAFKHGNSVDKPTNAVRNAKAVISRVRARGLSKND